jgi:hypothetical protein
LEAIEGIMGHHLLVGAMYVIETMFFLGLIGCAFAVVLSWIDILRDGFNNNDEPKIDEQSHKSATTPSQDAPHAGAPFAEAHRAAAS